MQPYDGSGYGKSTYWTWQMASVAEQNGEACPCWDTTLPTMKIIDGEEIKIKIICISKTVLCKESFPKTEKEMKERFTKFYKGNP